MGKLIISVVVPAYNEEKYICDCLDSLVNQSCSKNDYEIIVVDNNSTDRTADIVRKKYPKVKVVNEEKQGVVFARIRGAKKAKGEILAFIDADSYAPKSWLKDLQEPYKDPEIVAVGGLVDYYPKAIFAHITQIYDKIYYPLLNLMPASNLSLRKKNYDECGGFSPKINTGEAEYIISRVKEKGKVVVQKNNLVITSSRRLISWDIISFSMKYAVGSFFTIVFKKQLFFGFKPIRDRGFLKIKADD